jgi:hypothetical protein
MTSSTLKIEIQNLVPKLLQMARTRTCNRISDNCKFILSEIKQSQLLAPNYRTLWKKENDRKLPLSFDEFWPAMEKLYENLYDINLHIYKATKKLTIIEIRYYPRTSLEEDYRQRAVGSEPLLHCKIEIPPWLDQEKKKFDINWQHYETVINWKTFWMGIRLKTQRR